MPSEKESEPRVVHAEFYAGSVTAKHLPPPAMAEFAFAGRSNVGKSSLLNALTQRIGLVRTSRTPGCTRQINVFIARLADGFEAHLVDLPGYGFAARSKAEKGEWGPMIEGYLGTRITLRALCILVDVRRGPEREELQLIEFMRARVVQSSKPVELLLVATKIDKIPANERKPALAKLKQKSELPVIGFSGETGEGRKVVWERLKGAAL